MGIIRGEKIFEGTIPFVKTLNVLDDIIIDDSGNQIDKTLSFNLSFNALYSSKLSYQDRSKLVIGLKNFFLTNATPNYIEATTKLSEIKPTDKFATCIEIRGHYTKYDWDLENYVFWYRKAITDLLCSGKIKNVKYFDSKLKDDISQITMNTAQIVNDVEGVSNTLCFHLVRIEHPQVPLI